MQGCRWRGAARGAALAGSVAGLPAGKVAGTVPATGRLEEPRDPPPAAPVRPRRGAALRAAGAATATAGGLRGPRRSCPLPAGLGGAAAPRDCCAPSTARRGAGRPAVHARGLAPPAGPVGSGTAVAQHGRPVLRRLAPGAPGRGSTCRRLPGLSRWGSAGVRSGARPPRPVGALTALCAVSPPFWINEVPRGSTGVRAVVQPEFGKTSAGRVCGMPTHPPERLRQSPSIYLKPVPAVFPSPCESQGRETQMCSWCGAMDPLVQVFLLITGF